MRMDIRTAAVERMYIKNIQKYLGLPMNGRFDDRLRRKISAFQRDNGLKETGKVTFSTFEVMKRRYIEVTPAKSLSIGNSKGFPYSRGMIGDDVSEINRMLSNLLAAYEYDGILPRGKLYDEKTVNAVRAARRIFGKGDRDSVDRALYIRLMREMLITN